MIEVFVPIKKFMKFDHACIDNMTFKLHYKVSIMILIACSMMVAAKQYIGVPIECLSDTTLKRETINTYCWIHATYTHVSGSDGLLDIHPGVRNVESAKEEKYYKYYQWVAFMLILQSILFYLPRMAWKYIWEGGRMLDLVTELKAPIGDPEKRAQRKPLLLEYMFKNLNKNQSYVSKFLLCEFFNLVNILGQIFLTDRFLEYQFTNYGWEVLRYRFNSEPEDTNPMEYFFPKMAKCKLNIYGPSGNKIPYDCLCILPINNLNEKVYVVLWTWFFILAIITTLSIIYRIVTCLSKHTRARMLANKLMFPNVRQCYFITERISYSDWFVLNQIGHNVDSYVFIDLLDHLEAELGEKKV